MIIDQESLITLGYLWLVVGGVITFLGGLTVYFHKKNLTAKKGGRQR